MYMHVNVCIAMLDEPFFSKRTIVWGGGVRGPWVLIHKIRKVSLLDNFWLKVIVSWYMYMYCKHCV